jgi:ketosteroid isomerase-like protein
MPRSKVQPLALWASPEDVETQFYEALQEADLDKLMSLWAEDEEIFCIHPGGARVLGHAAVRAAFEAIFSNGGIKVSPGRLHSVQTIGVAVHSVLERIKVETPRGAQSGWVMATNVYLNTPQGWRLLAHHASPGADDEAGQTGDAPAVLH